VENRKTTVEKLDFDAVVAKLLRTAPQHQKKGGKSKPASPKKKKHSQT
jgi:hypothetical protein